MIIVAKIYYKNNCLIELTKYDKKEQIKKELTYFSAYFAQSIY